MTPVIVLLLGLALAVVAWRWSSSGQQRAHELVIVVTLAMLAATCDVIVPIPDVEATTTVVTCVALVLGARAGILTAALAVLLSGAVSGLGPWVPWQVVAFTLVAIVAAATGRAVAPDRLVRDRRLVLVALTIVLVAGYDALTTVTTTTLVANLPMREAGHLLLLGLPFTVIHVAASVVVTLVAAPVLLPGLQRVRRRLDVQVDERPIPAAD